MPEPSLDYRHTRNILRHLTLDIFPVRYIVHVRVYSVYCVVWPLNYPIFTFHKKKNRIEPRKIIFGLWYTQQLFITSTVLHADLSRACARRLLCFCHTNQRKPRLNDLEVLKELLNDTRVKVPVIYFFTAPYSF